jgi:hypothetical protein
LELHKHQQVVRQVRLQQQVLVLVLQLVLVLRPVVLQLVQLQQLSVLVEFHHVVHLQLEH